MMPVLWLASLAPIVDWNAYLSSLGVNQQNVTQPKYIKPSPPSERRVPLDDWKTLLPGM
jgi:hypothetical protein